MICDWYMIIHVQPKKFEEFDTREKILIVYISCLGSLRYSETLEKRNPQSNFNFCLSEKLLGFQNNNEGQN